MQNEDSHSKTKISEGPLGSACAGPWVLKDTQEQSKDRILDEGRNDCSTLLNQPAFCDLCGKLTYDFRPRHL